ncbi:MAG TPA: GntR family transcriptional regulator [Pirellulales bacterium]|jgi:DNA-binding GntR family transcriptional regulator|nr:GntR family transcriptional regulator [Pirellulales bacterium]
MPTRQAPRRKQSLAGSATLGQTVFETLRSEIASGVLAPGEPLSRRAIASRFGCSYSTVVEVMVRLESTELIEAETAQIARVVRPSIERIRDVHVLIEAIETQAIRLACDAATQADIDELYAMAEALEKRIDARDPDDRQVPLLHVQFHKRITQAGRAPALLRAQERSQLVVCCHRHAIVTAKELPDPPRWHLVLVDAIQARDPLAADAAMRAHTRRGMEKDLLAYQLAAVQ